MGTAQVPDWRALTFSEFGVLTEYSAARLRGQPERPLNGEGGRLTTPEWDALSPENREVFVAAAVAELQRAGLAECFKPARSQGRNMGAGDDEAPVVIRNPSREAHVSKQLVAVDARTGRPETLSPETRRRIESELNKQPDLAGLAVFANEEGDIRFAMEPVRYWKHPPRPDRED